MTNRAPSPFERFCFQNARELMETIRALGLEIPLSENRDALFQPLEVEGRTLPNRLVIQPMEGADGDENGAPGPLTFRRYRRFAAGGAGLIWFEATAVTPSARSNPAQLCLTPENRDAFARLVEDTRRAAQEGLGPERTPLCLLQLTHPGRFTREGLTPCPVLARHDPILDPLVKAAPDHPLMTDRELDAIQEAFLRAARRASEAGFHGVDVKACHGYLLSELLGARNRKDSRYGGPFENRARFLLNTVRRIRKEVPDLLVAVRMNAWDGLPPPHGFGGPPEDEEGFKETLALVERLRDAGVALLNVSIGIPALHPHRSRPHDHPASGGEPPPEHPLEGVDRLLRAAARIQTAFPDLPVVSTGYSWLRHLFPPVAAAMVERRRAALAGIGRMAFAYPDCVKELEEKGRIDPKQCCVTCSACSRLLREGGPAGCLVRDWEVYARHGG